MACPEQCSQHGRTDDIRIDSEGNFVLDTGLGEIKARIRRWAYPLPRLVGGKS